MKYIAIWSYDNYVPAHIAMGRLKEEGIESWLKDENTITIDPILTNAVGGIKLMVGEPEAKKAWDILQELQKSYKASLACPHCGSHNFEWVSTPRKPMNWISAVSTWLISSFALSAEKTYHCFNCGKEFEEPVGAKNRWPMTWHPDLR